VVSKIKVGEDSAQSLLGPPALAALLFIRLRWPRPCPTMCCWWSTAGRSSAPADPAKPGRYLANGGSAKSGLNRAVLSKGCYRFELALTSVSRYSGTQVVKVPAAFTSQRCGVWACGPEIP
jgi:transposase